MLLTSILQDLRIGLRVLLKEKSFCALAVTVLALGICAVTTQFTVVNATLLRGLSFPESERLVAVQLVNPAPTNPNGFNGGRNTPMDFEELKAAQNSFAGFDAYLNGSTVNVTYKGVPQRYTGAYITADLFRTLGIAPAMGRDFTAADNQPGAESTVLLSHQLWERDFNKDPEIVGQSIRLNGHSATIVGVMPPKFKFPFNEELWIPLYNEYPIRPRNDQSQNTIQIVGRLKPGISIDQATLEGNGLAKNMANAYPETNKDLGGVQVRPLVENFTGPAVRGLMITMLAFCAGVLLLACANVMNMQFARATLRGKELAVRSSLGATRSRLMRQMLTESLLIASIGAAIGIAGAYWAVDLLAAVSSSLPFPQPYWIVYTIDGPVLAFTVGATMLAAVVSGLVPAWLASRVNATDVLKEAGRGNTGRLTNLLTRSLVVFQILVTCVLLVASMLQLKSILKQQNIDFGYDTDSVFSARLGLFEADYPTPQAKMLFYDRVLRQLRANPELSDAALSLKFRMTFTGTSPIEIEGQTYRQPTDRPFASNESVSDGYFSTLGSKLVDGRDFAADDSDQKLPVAIVNATFAKKFFGNDNPIGRRIRAVGPNELFGPWRTIVGIAPDMRMSGPFQQRGGVGEEGFYVPYHASLLGPVPAVPAVPRFVTVLARPRGDQSGVAAAAALRREMQKIDSNLPLYFAATPGQLMSETLGQTRINATMFTIFGFVALILASVGLYGVTSFSVNQRTQEFGIRMALGADRTRILRMVLQQGVAQLGLGLALGLCAALAIGTFAAQGISIFLYQTSPRDPATYLTVFAVLSAVSIFATLIPARRATRVDPMVALRAE